MSDQPLAKLKVLDYSDTTAASMSERTKSSDQGGRVAWGYSFIRERRLIRSAGRSEAEHL
jgi:hypothetical protein